MEMAVKTRNALIEQKRREGATMKALATEFNISPSRVQQILARGERNRRRVAHRLEAPLRHITRPIDADENMD